MISHEYKCIFIHIPKCAGTSIESALGHFDKSAGRGRQDHRSVRMLEKPFPILKSAKNIENIKDTIRRFREYTRSSSNVNNTVTCTKEQYDEYFKFTIVRNPWDRAVSWYKNAMRDRIHQKNYGIPNDISFKEFVFRFSGSGFLRPQTYWLENYENKVKLDFIGKFENLECDYRYILNRLGLPKIELPHEVSGASTRTPTSFYDEELLNFMHKFYEREILLFEYNYDTDCIYK